MILALFLVLVPVPQAESAPPQDKSETSVFERALANTSADEGTPGLVDLECPCASIEDQESQEACWKAYRAMLGYYERGLDHRTRVFSWQHLSTRLIFFVVLGLVSFGASLAWIQFRQTPRVGVSSKSSETDARSGSGEAPEQAHEVELSAKGLRVSSPVLGVVILALSMGFFYLYLVYVYPITEVL